MDEEVFLNPLPTASFKHIDVGVSLSTETIAEAYAFFSVGSAGKVCP